MTDKELFEKVCREGECWHEWEHFGDWHVERSKCVKCGFSTVHYYFMTANPDFSTPDGFFWLWERCVEKDWWWDFIYNIIYEGKWKGNNESLINVIVKFNNICIHPFRFTKAIKSFMGVKNAN